MQEIYISADKDGFGEEKRKSIQLHLDGRDISMETILASIRHNMTEEYPRLLRMDDEYTVMVIQAMNLNDRYRILQLSTAESVTLSSTKTAIQKLREHLDQMPSESPV